MRAAQPRRSCVHSQRADTVELISAGVDVLCTSPRVSASYWYIRAIVRFSLRRQVGTRGGEGRIPDPAGSPVLHSHRHKFAPQAGAFMAPVSGKVAYPERHALSEQVHAVHKLPRFSAGDVAAGAALNCQIREGLMKKCRRSTHREKDPSHSAPENGQKVRSRNTSHGRSMRERRCCRDLPGTR